MDVVLVLGAIAVVAALIVRAGWRHAVDERQSVRDYHQALETLRHLSDRSSDAAAGPHAPEAPGGHLPPAAPRREEAVRSETLLGRSAPGNGASTRSPSPVPARGYAAIARAVAARPAPPVAPRVDDAPADDGDGQGAHPADTGAPPPGERAPMLVFGAEGDETPVAATAEAPPLRAASALRRVGLRWKRLKVPDGLRHRPPRTVVLAAASVVLLAALVAIVVTVASTGSHRSISHTRASSVSAHRSGPRPAASSPGSSSSSTQAPQTLQPTTSSATQAAYLVPLSSYTVALSASGTCWVNVSATDTGKVLWTGVLAAGQTQQVPVTGSSSLRLGAAFDVNVTVNGVSVVLPDGHGSPFNVAFKSA